MLRFIGKQFRKPSGFGGRIISFMMKRSNKVAYEIIIPKLEIKQHDRILEIGYGHGIGVDMICKQFDCHVTGIDFSELMFKEAQIRNKKHIEDNKASLHYGNYLDFDCALNSFDKIFFINVIYFWENIEIPFNKIKRDLKPGGKVCIYMAHKDLLKKFKFTTDDIFNKYTIEYVCEELRKQEFQNIEYTYDRGYFITFTG